MMILKPAGAGVETSQTVNDAVSKSTGTAGRLLEGHTAPNGQILLYAVDPARDQDQSRDQDQNREARPPSPFIPFLPEDAACPPKRRPALGGLRKDIEDRLGRLYACFEKVSS